MRMEVVVVAAVAENGVIGADGEMPWHYPADLEHFKETTTGHPVIVGRRTYEAIVDALGGPLPGRTNVVLSTRDLDLPAGAVRADSVDAALSIAREAAGSDESEDGTGSGATYVVGGARVYEQFLPLADRMLLTEIPERPDGDTHFPEWDSERWREVDRERRGDVVVVTYERRES